ncbi:MAG: hypothetical protein WA902_19325 [Thermosynechococcaceae cyanobacterium]
MNINFPFDSQDFSAENFEIFERSEIKKTLKEFIEVYKGRPFENSGGMKLNSAFSYYFLLKKINPNFVVESGIWRGFSTWLIEETLENPKVLCLDPVLMMPLNLGEVYRSKNATYSTHDFSCSEIRLGLDNEACVIFDDHQNALPRLEQAAQYGFKHIIFDDNLYKDTYHVTLMNLIRDKHPVLEYMFEYIESCYLFPSIMIPLEYCPVQPLFSEVPIELQDFNLDEELEYTWVTYIKVKP